MIDFSIPGWSTQEQLEFIQALAQELPENGVIAEVGCLFGRSSYVFASSMPTSAKLYCIDPFVGGDAYTGKEFGKNMLTKANSKENFAQSLEQKGVKGFYPIQGYSPLANWEHELLDMVFIDADHSYESVRADVEFWQKFLKPGGLICGDDYASDASAPFPGVKKAVQELKKNNQVALYNHIWMYVNSSTKPLLERVSQRLESDVLAVID